MKYFYLILDSVGKPLYGAEKKYWIVHWYKNQDRSVRRAYKLYSIQLRYPNPIIVEKDEAWLGVDDSTMNDTEFREFTKNLPVLPDTSWD